MSEMVPHTDATIRAVVRTLARAAAERDAGRMTGAAFDALSTELGWSHSSDNILLDEFDVESAVHVDWFHTYLHTGIFNYEVAFLFTCFRHGAGAVKNVTFDMAREFASKFKWPRRLASPAHLLRKDRVSKESLHFKCSGSEGLCLYPILAMFLQVVVLPQGGCVPQITSLLALRDVLDMLDTAKKAS